MSSLDSMGWCPALEQLYSETKLTGRSGKVFDALGSLSTRNNINFLRKIMLEQRPRRTLEIGMAFGGSTLAIATCHRDVGNSSTHVHTAIDLAQTSYWDNVATLQLEKAGLSALVRTIEKPSAVALAHLFEGGERFGLIYVDGSHQFEDVFVDFYFSARLLDANGVILFDDCADPHIRKVVRFILKNYSGVFAELPLEKHVAGTQQRLRRTVGIALGKVQMRAFRKIKSENANIKYHDF